MPNLFQGRIVYVAEAVPDPQGQNPKANRPFVVISPPAEIAAGGNVELVAISHSVQNMDAATDVLLDHGPNCMTFDTPSVAVCKWRVEMDDSRFSISTRLVKPLKLRAILEIVDRLKGGG